MNETNDSLNCLLFLTDDEMAQVMGGWHPFLRGIFGSDGKPFIGRDVVETALPAAVKMGVSVIPGGAGMPATAAAVAFKAILVRNR